MVIPPPIKSGRITNFLKPYVLRMHFSNKYVSAQVVHTPTASVASSASSQEKALRPTMENTRDVAAAAKIGKILGERLMLKEIPAVTVFYKKDQKYHGQDILPSDLLDGNVRAGGENVSEEPVKVTRSIMIMKPPGIPNQGDETGTPPASPAGSTPPISPLSGGGAFRFRRRSTSDAYEKTSGIGSRSPRPPYDM